MKHDDIVQEISLEYMEMLKKEVNILQKDMANELGISEGLISKWKNGSRKISPEYYVTLEKYFTKVEFENIFSKNHKKLFYKLENIDNDILQEEFWNKLFGGEYQQWILKNEERLHILYQIFEIRIKFQKNMEIDFVTDKSLYNFSKICVTYQKKIFYLYWGTMEELVIENGTERYVIGKKNLDYLAYSFYFIYRIDTKVSDKILIEMNKYAEIVMNKICEEKI